MSQGTHGGETLYSFGMGGVYLPDGVVAGVSLVVTRPPFFTTFRLPAILPMLATVTTWTG